MANQNSKSKKRIIILVSSIALLLITTMTSVLAWFTMSSSLDVQGLGFYTRVSDTLVISTDGETWTSSVKGSDFEVDITELKNVPPTTYLGYNLFGQDVDGQLLKPFKKLTDGVAKNIKTISYYTTPSEFSDATENKDYYVAPIYIKSSKNMDIYLNRNSYIMPVHIDTDEIVNADYIVGCARLGIFDELGNCLVVWAPNASISCGTNQDGVFSINENGTDVNHNVATYVDGFEYNFVSTLNYNMNEEGVKILSNIPAETPIKLYAVIWLEGEDSEAISLFSGGSITYCLSLKGERVVEG